MVMVHLFPSFLWALIVSLTGIVCAFCRRLVMGNSGFLCLQELLFQESKVKNVNDTVFVKVGSVRIGKFRIFLCKNPFLKLNRICYSHFSVSIAVAFEDIYRYFFGCNKCSVSVCINDFNFQFLFSSIVCFFVVSKETKSWNCTDFSIRFGRNPQNKAAFSCGQLSA